MSKPHPPPLTKKQDDLMWAALRAALHSGPIEHQELDPAALAVLTRHAQGMRLSGVFAQGAAALGWNAPMPLHSRAQGARIHFTRALLANALDKAGVAHVFLKGALTDAVFWGGQGLRGSGDVDVLVEPGAISRARQVLWDLGYAQDPSRTHPMTEAFSKETLWKHSVHAAVDLHVDAVNSPPFARTGSAVFLSRVAYAVPDGRIWGPDPAWHLAFLAGNLASDRFLPRFKLALDAACVIQHHQPNFAQATAHARHLGCDWSLWALLHLVASRLRVTIPPSVLSELAPPPAMALWISQVAGITGPMLLPRGTLPKLILTEWPLSQRLSWVPHKTARWAGLRVLDRLVGGGQGRSQ